MKKFTLICIVEFICFNFFLNSCLSQFTWEKISHKSRIFYHVIETKDSCFVTAGVSHYLTDDKIYIQKFNRNGDSVWTFTFDTTVAGYFYPFWIEQTMDSGFVITGSNPSSRTILLLKLDKFGFMMWTKTYGGSNVDQGYCVKQTSDKGYILQCRTTSYSSNNDMLLIKTDSLGNLQWQKLFDYSYEVLPEGMDLIDSSFYIVASSIFQIGQWERIKVFKLKTTGDVIWNKEFTYNGWVTGAKSIKYTSKETIVLTGEVFYSGLTYILNLDTSGNVIWEKIYSYTGLYEGGTFIDEAVSRGYIVCSIADSNAIGIKYGVLRFVDYNGNLKFERFRDYGKFEVYYKCVKSVTDNGFILCGNLNSSSTERGYVLKTDSLGDLKPSSVSNNAELIGEFKLYQNYPNPFNTQTIIPYTLNNSGDVRIEIFDVLGRRITLIQQNNQMEGKHHFIFNADDYNLSSGIYFCIVNFVNDGEQFVAQTKMLFVK